MRKAKWGPIVALAFMGAAVVVVSFLYASTGAIWTTNVSCGTVNVNLYELKADVYLNGGPAGGGGGLPDGNYYVQVTTPDGGTVLGKTPSNLSVTVTDGRFDSCYRLIDICYTGSSNFSSPGYDTTSNNGGEYKVWASKDPDFAGGTNKTDNFKVREGINPPPEPAAGSISGKKFYDLDLSGSLDGSEVGIAGWKIQLYLYTPIPDTDPVPPADCDSGTWSFVAEMVTDGNGDYLFPDITLEGYYKVVEVFPLKSDCGDWEPTTPATCILLDMTTLQDYTGQNFGNVCYLKGGLTIGYWKNHAVAAPKGPKPDPIFNTLTWPIYLGAEGCFAIINSRSEVVTQIGLAEASSELGKFMLAAQLLAAQLNVLKFAGCSFGSAIYVGNVSAYTGMTVTAIIAAADDILCDSVSKDEVITVKDALDQINNNETIRVLLGGSPCAVAYPPVI